MLRGHSPFLRTRQANCKIYVKKRKKKEREKKLSLLSSPHGLRQEQAENASMPGLLHES